MPVYDYIAAGKKSCPKCKDGFEIVMRMSDERLKVCPECGAPVNKVITAPALGRSKTKLDDRAKSAGFHKLKKVDKGAFEKLY